MNNVVYFDNSATTKPCNRAVEYINRCLTDNWGNPSSLHRLGIDAELEMNAARSTVAGRLACRDDEIVFTSGGTEANNLAVIGGAAARSRRGKRIITTAIEHPSVLNAVKSLEESGFDVVYLKPLENGIISIDDLRSALTPDTVLVSIMLVNNELGSIQPVSAAVKTVRECSPSALVHCDAVQAFGKIAVSVKRLGVDLLSISGHKIHGPKGVGALYKAKGITLRSTVFGGGQENGLRSGTEAVPLISGLRGAIEELPDTEKQLEIQRELNDYARKQLLQTGIVEINSSEDALPYILNISVPGYRSETLLHSLETDGIFVSSGSACARGRKSYVLSQSGISRRNADSALRLSFSRYNTKSEIDLLTAALERAAGTLKRV